MSELMSYPGCGKDFHPNESELLDNGNPACPDCVREEREKLDK